MQDEMRRRDRLESLKAGLLGATALLPTELLLLGGGWVRSSVLPHGWDALAPMSAPAALLLLGHLGATGLVGFLLGVTYRYAIRRDQNRQLQIGTVLAFTLARGLAQAELGWQLDSDWRLWGGLVAESVGLFAIAALLLTVALQNQWIAPVPTAPDSESTGRNPKSQSIRMVSGSALHGSLPSAFIVLVALAAMMVWGCLHCGRNSRITK